MQPQPLQTTSKGERQTRDKRRPQFMLNDAGVCVLSSRYNMMVRDAFCAGWTGTNSRCVPVPKPLSLQALCKL